jgi:hypothetical protein
MTSTLTHVASSKLPSYTAYRGAGIVGLALSFPNPSKTRIFIENSLSYLQLSELPRFKQDEVTIQLMTQGLEGKIFQLSNLPRSDSHLQNIYRALRHTARQDKDQVVVFQAQSTRLWPIYNTGHYRYTL